MPITVQWGNAQKTITETVFDEVWTLEEAHQMIDDIYALTTSVDHIVHAVWDFSNSRSSPTKLMSVGHHLNNRVIHSIGINVFVKANAFVKAMVLVVERMFSHDAQPLYFANSVEEAYQIIEKYEQTHIES